MKIFNKAEYDVLPLADFKPFLDFENYSFPTPESVTGKALVKFADEALETEIPQLYASVYRRFFIDGNRTEFQDGYYERRLMLKKLIYGELTLKNGKYISKMIDLLWLIMEETTWIIPAHNHYPVKENKKNDTIGNEFCGDALYLDLYAAETASEVAVAYYFFKDEFAEITPIINERIMYELRRRIIRPYNEHRDFYWMSLDGRKNASNWTMWITSNVLAVTALVEDNMELRKGVFDKALECIDEFVDTYKPDGGCTEGPGYWKCAVGGLFNSLETLYDMTDGKVDVFDHPLLYNMFDYIRKVHLTGFYYSNFSDCQAQLYKTGMIIAVRMGIRTKNSDLYSFALENSPEYITDIENNEIFCELKNLCFRIPEKKEQFIPNDFDVLENLQVAVQRSDDGFITSMKGGHNSEIHNHNDVGNIIVMYGKDPLLIDIGAPTYTKFSFGETRYTVFPNNSDWHNLPEVNGFTQHKGEEFRADSFFAEKGRTVVDYTSAYEKDAGIIKAEREVLFSKNEVIVNERLDFVGESAVFRYYMRECPVKDGNTYIFENGVKMTVPEANEIIPIPLDDRLVINGWETKTLYCLNVKVSPENSSFTLKLEK